jgi:CopA family copper-resistance protein
MRLFLLLAVLLQAAPALAKTYDLEIKKQDVFLTGKAVEAITINDEIPGPILRFREGEDVEIRVKNSMDEVTSIHWHGILLPGEMDGVPGLNGFNGIPAGETFTYKFKIRQTGTYWYHSHSNMQEQRGMYGAIVIEPAKKVERDYVILLSDFSEEKPAEILNNLKLDSAYYNKNKRTLGTFIEDSKKYGFFTALKDRTMWGEMRMDATDLSDVGKYTFLTNGQKNWEGIFKKNERILKIYL